MRWSALQSAMRQRWQALAAAFAAFVVVFALRLIDPNANDGVALLYVVPIAVLAAEFGLAGGPAAALVACGLVGIWIAVQDKDAAQGFETGADDYLRKPFKTNELLDLVASLLGRAS